jgi:integrase/recombinase XerD
MKPFESFIAPELEEYIRHRVSLGYNGRNQRSLLRPFDRYLKDNEYCWESITPKLFLELRRKLKGESSTINGILSGVRNFFQFLVHMGHYSHNPLRDIPPLPVGQYFPYIFSSRKIEELLKSIKARFPNDRGKGLEHASIFLSILLMAKCGLRISEPLGIIGTHYCQNEGTIYIEKTKFQNDRLIPAPKSVLLEIEKYLRMRNSMNIKEKNKYLLVGQKQKSLQANHIYTVFHNAVKDIGINETKRRIGNITFGSPTPHSLRHSFAVNTLNRIKERGKSIWDALPVLAVYLGHRKICSTTRYLTVLNSQHRQNLLDFVILHQDEL